MQTITLKAHVGNDGILKLDVPVPAKDVDVDVDIRLEIPEQPVNGLGWPPGYFERTFGSIQDESFERPDQGTFEIREEL